ncbi:MAG TPA: hypothetical protein VKB69_04820, partial [Micromonosporaceae bacterium]|nr:hypothetical protein [Micromonosporaceae bacterium]
NEFRFASIPKVMADELPMVESPALAIVVLLLGALGVFSERLAINLALGLGVAQLLAWGAVAARRAGWSWPATVAASAIDGALGLLIIGLKTIVH